MKFDDVYPSRFFKSDDFPTPRVLHIRTVQIEEVGQNRDRKAVIYFYEEPERAIILNKTNYGAIATAVGTDETDNWDKQPIEIYRDMTQFGGKLVPAIRMRAPRQSGQPNYPAAQPSYQPPRPSSAPQPGWRPPQPQPGQPMAPAYGLSDEVPDPDEPIRSGSKPPF